jgi:hypothetical protein
MKLSCFLLIICCCVFENIYCQADKFLIDELKAGLYYASDTSSEKEIYFLNNNLKRINHEKITDGTVFYKDHANIRIGKKYGFIDKEGNVKLFPEYSIVLWTDHLFGIAVKDKKIGYIDRQGNVKIPMKYDMGTFFYNHHAVVKENLVYSVINDSGQSVVTSKKLMFPPTKSSLIPYFSDSGQGMMSQNKHVVIEAIYRNLIDVGDGLIKAIRRGKPTYGILNTKGDTVIPFNYEEIKVAKAADLIPAKKNGKWGYINLQNETVIDFTYDEAYFFSEGLAAVVVGKKAGFINKKGKFIIEPTYDYSWNFGGNYNFKNGISAVLVNGKWGFITKKNRFVIQPSYDYVSGFIKGKAIVGINKKYGIISQTGTILVPLENDKIQRSDNGIFKVVKGIDKSPEDNGMENIKDVLLYQTLIYLYKS